MRSADAVSTAVALSHADPDLDGSAVEECVSQTGEASVPEPIDAEIRDATAVARTLLDAYVAFGGQYRFGEVHQWAYSEILEFVNFRLETADSCLLLASQDRVGDALGLCRSLLENYLC